VPKLVQAAAFLHGPDQLFGNVVALPTAGTGDALPGTAGAQADGRETAS
jgi:hypothetical protein